MLNGNTTKFRLYKYKCIIASPQCSILSAFCTILFFFKEKQITERAPPFSERFSISVILFFYCIAFLASVIRNGKKLAHSFFKMFLDRCQMFFRKIKPRMSFKPETDHAPELLLSDHTLPPLCHSIKEKHLFPGQMRSSLSYPASDFEYRFPAGRY